MFELPNSKFRIPHLSASYCKRNGIHWNLLPKKKWYELARPWPLNSSPQNNPSLPSISTGGDFFFLNHTINVRDHKEINGSQDELSFKIPHQMSQGK